MALQKPVPYRGTTLNYHRIIHYAQDALTGKTRVIVGGYVNHATRQDDPKAFLITVARNYDGLDLTRAALYDLLRADPFYSGSTNLL